MDRLSCNTNVSISLKTDCICISQNDLVRNLGCQVRIFPIDRSVRTWLTRISDPCSRKKIFFKAYAINIYIYKVKVADGPITARC